MSVCESIRDRMPDVLHRTTDWSADEAAHLAACRACAGEWAIVARAATLHADLRVDADAVAARVLARLRATPRRTFRAPFRIPVRYTFASLLAAAAVLAIILLPRGPRSPAMAVGDTAQVAILPELDGLDSTQLAAVLRSLGPTVGDAAPGVPHLGDLTEAELEQLLASERGE